jgi:hypothetical protein
MLTVHQDVGAAVEHYVKGRCAVPFVGDRLARFVSDLAGHLRQSVQLAMGQAAEQVHLGEDLLRAALLLRHAIPHCSGGRDAIADYR